jgi:hypothetical protein
VASSSEVAPATDYNSNASAPRTFEEKANKPPVPDKDKPAVDKELNPIPAPETKSSAMPTPSLPDPNNRTASRQPVYSSARVQMVAQPAKPAPVEDDGGWRAAKE